MYAACLQQMYPERLICYRYLCVPTGLKDPMQSPMPFIFNSLAQAETIKEILTYARKYRDSQARPRYARRCAWCNYKQLCMARITGADEDSTRKEFFQVKPDREDLTNLIEPDTIEVQVEKEGS